MRRQYVLRYVLMSALWLGAASVLVVGCDLERRRIGADSDEDAEEVAPAWPEQPESAEAVQPEEVTAEPVVEPVVPAEPEPVQEWPPQSPPAEEPDEFFNVITELTIEDQGDDAGWPPTVGPGLLNGRWIGGKANRFSMLLEVDGTLITARDLGEERSESTLFEMVEQDGAHVTFRAAGAGEIVQIHALFLSRDEALIWPIEENDVGLLRRVVAAPAELLGEWQVVEEFDSEERGSVVIEPDTLYIADDERPWTMYALAQSGPTLDVVAVRSGSLPLNIRFRQLHPGVFLSWSDLDNEFMVFFRSGASPSWLGGPDEGPGDSGFLTPQLLPGTSVHEFGEVGDFEILTDTPSEVDHVRANLRRIATNAVGYFSTAQIDPAGFLVPQQFPASTDWTPPSADCGEDFSDPSAWLTPTWGALGFEPTAPHRYQYRFISESFVEFEAQARVDADCDGVYHKLSIAGFAGGEIGFDEIVEDNPGE